MTGKPRHPIHVLCTGESGAGKDTFGNTFPGPRLVWHLDGHGQDAPYMKHAQSIGELQEWAMGACKIQYRDIIGWDGLPTRIEYYSSDNPTLPDVAVVLETRMGMFYAEQGSWKTLLCGSLSSAALEGRLYEQFVMNPQFKDPRKWYGAATEYVERLIHMQKALTCNVMFMCHIGRTQDELGGELLYTVDLPGRLSWGAGRYFSEILRVYIQRDASGTAQRVLQTDGDGRYLAKNHIDADNPCWPVYESLWSNWK